MKKNKTLTALFLVLLLAITGCVSQKPQPETYIIPESYWLYCGMTAEDAVESFYELGTDFYTAAKAVEGNVQIELTPQQRDHLIQRNNDYIADLIADFKAYNSEYWYEPDATYQKLNFYFDEEIPQILHVNTIYNLVALYGMNYILENKTVDWNVELSIYNCHTNNLVVSLNCPYESVSYGPQEWAASYNGS